MSKDRIEFEYMPLSQLIAYPKNPKDHDIGQLSTTISGAIGYATPIVIDTNSGYIGAGHGRVEALQLLYNQNPKKPPKRIMINDAGEWMIPVNKLAFKDELELEAFILADNKLTELGGWDDVALADVLTDLAGAGGDLMPLTGFDGDDLDALLSLHNPMDITDENRLDQKKKVCCPQCGHEFTP